MNDQAQTTTIDSAGKTVYLDVDGKIYDEPPMQNSDDLPVVYGDDPCPAGTHVHKPESERPRKHERCSEQEYYHSWIW